MVVSSLRIGFRKERKRVGDSQKADKKTRITNYTQCQSKLYGETQCQDVSSIGGRLTEPWSILTETRSEQLTE